MKAMKLGRVGTGVSRHLVRGLFWTAMLAAQFALSREWAAGGGRWVARGLYAAIALGFGLSQWLRARKARKAGGTAAFPMGWAMFWLLCALLTFHEEGSITWELYAIYSCAALYGFAAFAVALARDRTRDKKTIERLEGELGGDR